ncbi:molybdate ABC transporter substrate-binding protein [uncultured Paenalcaligenes sp.]|uniref:molybdate ABC transporter substrate-binding protein n=1 Tax=uncultured Paenalcaligenes sp. TaxID=1588925 RepID=UPI00261799DA|nr:molybdate ABC transporter substrate-binding protein [uncultured Paenalcaligenes sp.]
MFKRTALSLFATLFLSPAFAADITVATAAGYRKPLNEVYGAFTEKTGINVESAFGNMKQIEAQAKQNPDIQLLVGDWFFIKPMGLAEDHQLIGQGKLVLVSPKTAPITDIQGLSDEKIQKIAIADRKNAIYGKAAIECFTHYQLTDQLDAKLIEVTTLPQVSTYVTTGEVDAGFVNLSEAMAHADAFATPVEMPQACYRPIELSAVPLTGRSDTTEAKALLEFMKTDIARDILKQHGL